MAGVLVGAAAGIALGRLRDGVRLQRIVAGARELARGNYAHRVMIPGDDGAAVAADALNALADEIQKEREASAARDSARRRLLANISHDLRTPITSIAGYVDALRRGLGEEPDRYLAVVASKTDDLARLTDDLFYAARMESGDLELACVRLDLAEAVRRAVLGFEGQLVETGARVQIDLPERPCFVTADPSAVNRILSNLVANTLRHAERMTVFAIEMSERDGRYVVRLSNDGPPLPYDPERLFERGVAGGGGGAGLGLSIARELAEMMGATLTAEDGTQRGVAFALVFGKEQFSES